MAPRTQTRVFANKVKNYFPSLFKGEGVHCPKSFCLTGMVSTSGSEHPIVTLPTRGSGVQAQIFLFTGQNHNLPVYRSTSQHTCVKVDFDEICNQLG